MRAYICTGCFILFDIITGLLKAAHEKNLDSTVLRQGLFNKCAEILAVIGAGLLQRGADVIELGLDVPTLPFVSAYVCIMETVSVIENLCIINPALSNLFGPYLSKLKGDNDKK